MSQVNFLNLTSTTLDSINLAITQEKLQVKHEGEMPTEILRGGNLIRSLRESTGWSQKRLAVETGLSQGYLCSIESDKIENPRYKTILSLARALGVGINFYDQGLADTDVFLKPQAKQVAGLNPQVPTRRLIEDFVPRFIAEVEIPSVRYIDYLPTYERVGDRILQLRINHPDRPSQGKIASSAGISQGYLSQLERENAKNPVENPPLIVLRKLARSLDANIYDLLDIKVIEYSSTIVLIDRFFRSSQVPPEAKAKIQQVINATMEVSKDPYFSQAISTPTSQSLPS